jgi:penicillin-binding protein 1A
MDRPHILIANPSDGGFFYWLGKLYLFSFIGLLALLLHALFFVYLYFARSVPEVPDLRTYADSAPGITQVFAGDGALLAEWASERREIVPLSRIPRTLIDAFVATEDRRFFEHGGLDLRGFLRALRENLRAGQVLQGGSTITQQVAKAFLSPERTFSRKVREAILARRLEARYSKREILSLYLNHIFLGHGAFGVQAAARRYFDRDVWDLALPDLALIAGMAKAPSRYSPIDHPQAALARRDVVLRNMVEAGLLQKDVAEPFFGRRIDLSPRRDPSRDVAPYFVEHVRRELMRHFGQKALYERGFRVETTVVPYMDNVAAESVDYVVRKLDKRQGWRGREAHLTGQARQVFLARAEALYKAPLQPDTLYLGLVESVRGDGAMVRVGKRLLPLPLSNMEWAARYSARDATNDRTISYATEALHPGDVVWVRLEQRGHIPRFTEFTYDEVGEAQWVPESNEEPDGAPRLALEQTPRPQGALFTFDLNTGYVLSMVGGNDHDRSEFNRVVQSCRQPGSAYKPIYYSLALDRGYSYETLWNDKVKAEVDPVTGEMWVPQNIDGSYGQQVTLERALVWSKNPPSVEIFKTVGAKDVAEWARTLGMTTPIHADDALALGASCVRIDELSRAFAIFARNGRPIDNVYVKRVLDRRGQVVLDRSAWDDPMLDGASRLDRIVASAGERPRPAIAERTAWLTGTLLRRVVSQGHSALIRATKLIAAGKTGTSSRTSDVWFVGYTSRWLSTAWVGDDTYERQLGYKDASFTLSVPLWARYMYAANLDQPLEELPLWRPEGVKPNDRGGPLKPGYPPPPAGGVFELPTKLQGLPVLTGAKGEPAPSR